MAPLSIAFCYDRKADYLAQGIAEEELTELDIDYTIEEIEKGLTQLGHSVERVGNIKALARRLVADEKPQWDLVFNITEGLYGVAREAQVPALLEAYQIPFTFSDAATLSLCLDKAKTKLVLAPYGIPTSPFAVVQNTQPLNTNIKNRGTEAVSSSPFSSQLHYPLFAKPVAEGSSKGVLKGSKIDSPEGLNLVVDELCRKFPGQNILIEKFLSGREFTVGIVGTGEKARVIGALEIAYTQHNNDKYSFDCAKNGADWENYLQENAADMDDTEVKKACEVALRAYKELGCRDAGRVDMRSDIRIDTTEDKRDREAQPHFLEINPVAGLRPNYSQLPRLAENNNISFLSLLDIIIQSASERIKK